MGLLKRAQELANKELANTPKPEQSCVRTLQEILTEFHHSADQIDYPQAVFEAFRQLIRFKWAVFMIPEEDSRQFYSWTSIEYPLNGIIHVSFDHPEIINPSKMTIPFILEHNSQSEEKQKGTLILLGEKESPSALIFCEEIPFENQELKADIQTLSKHLSPKINQSRNLVDINYNNESLEPEKWLNNLNENKALVLILELEDACNKLMEAIPGMHINQANEEIAGVLRHLKGRMGHLYNLRDGRVLLLFSRKRIPDQTLYLHQLINAFNSVMGITNKQTQFNSLFIEWPEKKDLLTENLPGIFS